MALQVKVSVDAKGFKDWAEAVAAKSPEALRSFLYGAGDILYDSFVRSSPRVTGYMIGTTTVEVSDRSVRVGPTAAYAKFVDQGTSPHTIFARPGGVLAFDVGGQTVFARSVRHPGSPGRFFVKTAKEESQEAIRKLALDTYKQLYGAT